MPIEKCRAFRVLLHWDAFSWDKDYIVRFFLIYGWDNRLHICAYDLNPLWVHIYFGPALKVALWRCSYYLLRFYRIYNVGNKLDLIVQFLNFGKFGNYNNWDELFAFRRCKRIPRRNDYAEFNVDSTFQSSVGGSDEFAIEKSGLTWIW